MVCEDGDLLDELFYQSFVELCNVGFLSGDEVLQLLDTTITKGLQWQLQRIEQIDFRNIMENFVIVGDCATGKTSLASEIGRYALLKRAKVQYIS
ncbi:ATP-binding protein [Eubacterium pyruvativorans]|uniref:ATP-binding protein n=1 Tax=Eubacterium pyruvativorans TaxID=155865 RepID=UPI0015A2A39C|nr:ATP-binding protein [Eubacterium pyruvativorans]